MIFETICHYKEDILKEVNALIVDYESMDAPEIMARVTSILDQYRQWQSLEKNHLYLALQQIRALEPVLSQLANHEEQTQEIVDRITMIHVDEPDCSFIQLVKQLAVLMEERDDIDQQIFYPAIRTHLSPTEIETLEERFQKESRHSSAV